MAAELPSTRRTALACMGLAAGSLFALSSGVARAVALDDAAPDRPADGLGFVQISDTHIGFAKPANPDPIATLRATIARIRALPAAPAFIVHTGDVTHLATPEQFATARQLVDELSVPVFLVPGPCTLR